MSSLTVSPAFAQRFGRILLEQKELPRNVFNELPFSVQVSQDTLLQKRLNLLDLKNVSLEQDLVSRESRILYNRFDHFDKVNIIDILMTSPSYALPLVLELMGSQQMGWYGAVSSVPNMAQVATEKMRIFALEAKLKTFPTYQIKQDAQINSFAQDVATLIKKEKNENQKNCNLFLLHDSSLGRYLDPEGFLRNIYDSMSEGDYFIISQGLHKSGRENDLLADYQKMATKFGNSRFLADLISPESPLVVEWENSRFTGINVYVQAEKEVEIMGAKIQAGEKISVLRNARFQEIWLKQIFEKIGFEILEVAYNKDYAMFLLQK